jgi:hypothetical protein
MRNSETFPAKQLPLRRFPGLELAVELVHPPNHAIFDLLKKRGVDMPGSAPKVSWHAKAMASVTRRSCRSMRDTIASLDALCAGSPCCPELFRKR